MTSLANEIIITPYSSIEVIIGIFTQADNEAFNAVR